MAKYVTNAGLDRQITGGPDIRAAQGKEQIDFRRPAANTLYLGESGNGFLIVIR